MQLHIEKYKPEYKNIWNDFIDKSKNGTFLFKREFMEYHQYKFKDFSLMIFDEAELVALLPANLADEGTVISHEGLTYGGFVLSPLSSVTKILSYLEFVLKWLSNNGILCLKVKHIPDFYINCSQGELEYAYFLLDAKNYRTDCALAFEYNNIENRQLPKGRKSEIVKAKKLNVIIQEKNSFDDFWNIILIPNLFNRFGVLPVHSLQEISILKEYNFNYIKQFNALYNNRIVAGATIFETKTTAHVQYLAGNDDARKTGALDYLFYYLIDHFSKSKKYFDFGIVNENQGRSINFGMLKWKESFGCRAFLHKFYEIETKKHENLSLNKLEINS